MDPFVPIGVLWRRPRRAAIRALASLFLALGISACGAHWWLHEDGFHIALTVVFICVFTALTDAVRYRHWRRTAGRARSEAGPDPQGPDVSNALRGTTGH